MDIAETQARIVEYCKAKGWHDDGRTFGDHISLLHAELSEALEQYRDNHLSDKVYWEYDENNVLKPEGVGVELADVLIRLLHTSAQFGIDLEEALSVKLIYNDMRAYRHGGKLL